MSLNASNKNMGGSHKQAQKVMVIDHPEQVAYDQVRSRSTMKMNPAREDEVRTKIVYQSPNGSHFATPNAQSNKLMMGRRLQRRTQVTSPANHNDSQTIIKQESIVKDMIQSKYNKLMNAKPTTKIFSTARKA